MSSYAQKTLILRFALKCVLALLGVSHTFTLFGIVENLAFGSDVGAEVVGTFVNSMPASTLPMSGAIGTPGAGLILTSNKSKKISLELGGLLLNAKMNNGADQTIMMAQGFLGLNLRLGSVVSFDLGGYGNNHLKDTLSVTGKDGGVFAGIKVRFWPTHKSGIVLRVHYDRALTTILETRGEYYVPHNLIFMFGIPFGSSKKK